MRSAHFVRFLGAVAVVCLTLHSAALLRGARHGTGRSLLWSESYIGEQLEKLEPCCPSADYEPQLWSELVARNANAAAAAAQVAARAALAAPFAAARTNESPFERQLFRVDNNNYPFYPDCIQSVDLHDAFERAWARYTTLHKRIVYNELPPRFVHVGFPQDADVAARMKVIVSAALLALLTDRALVVSWVPTPRDSGHVRKALPQLFRAPGIDWWYTPEKFAASAFKRFAVRGFGQEVGNNTFSYEPNELLCSDVVNDDTPWFEFHWKYDAFGHVAWRNPSLRARAASLFDARDTFGPLARKLFVPVPRLWKRVRAFYREHMDAALHMKRTNRTLRTIAIEVERDAEKGGFYRCLRHIGADDWLTRRQRQKTALAKLRKSQNDTSLTVADLKAKRVRRKARELFNDEHVDDVNLIIVTPYQPWLASKLGSAFDSSSVVHLVPAKDDLGHDKSRFTTAYPNEEWEIVAYFVKNLAHVTLLSARTSGARLMHSSRAPWIVDNAALASDGSTLLGNDNDNSNDNAAGVIGDAACFRDTQCQPCFNWRSVRNATCFDERLESSLPSQSVSVTPCAHSLWYRW